MLVPGVVVAPLGEEDGPAGIGVTGVTTPGFVVPGAGDGVAEPGVAPVAPVVPNVPVPLAPVAPGVVESGWPAPFDGGVVDAPGPVLGAQGAITSAFGTPFEPTVPAEPAVPTAPGVAPGDTIPGVKSVPGVVLVPGVALPRAVPFVPVDVSTPLVPVDPVSGTHGIVAGGIAVGIAGAVTPDGDEGDCVAIEGVCANAGAATASAATATQAMNVEVLCMTPPYSRGEGAQRMPRIGTTRCNGRGRLRQNLPLPVHWRS